MKARSLTGAHNSGFIIVIDLHIRRTTIMAIRKRVAYLLLAASIIMLLVLSVRATTESFTVPAGEDETTLLNLTTRDHVRALANQLTGLIL
jgi:hypothetical protein